MAEIPNVPVETGTILRQHDGSYWLVIGTTDTVATLAAIALQIGTVATDELGDYYPVTSDELAQGLIVPTEPIPS